MNRPVSQIGAIGLALAGFALWVLCDTCIKLAGESALPIYEVVAFIGLAGLLILVPRALLTGGLKTLLPKRPRDQALRALLTLAIVFCNVVALKHLTLSIFYILAFMAPLLIAVLAAIFLREHLDWKKSAAILAGFAGVVVAVHPGGEDMRGDWIGYLAMTTAAVVFALNAVCVRHMAQTETVTSLVFCQMLADIVVGGIPMLFHAAPVDLRLLLVLFAIGATDITGTICNSLALRHTAAATVGQFHYTQIVTGALLSYLIWGEEPTSYIVAGSAMIIASGLYIAAHARRADEAAAVSFSHAPPE